MLELLQAVDQAEQMRDWDTVSQFRSLDKTWAHQEIRLASGGRDASKLSQPLIRRWVVDRYKFASTTPHAQRLREAMTPAQLQVLGVACGAEALDLALQEQKDHLAQSRLSKKEKRAVEAKYGGERSGLPCAALRT